jgi:hypothetical protein
MGAMISPGTDRKRKRPASPGVSEFLLPERYWGFACADTAFADAITGRPFN